MWGRRAAPASVHESTTCASRLRRDRAPHLVSLSLWERAGVRVHPVAGAMPSAFCRPLALTLSPRERERGRPILQRNVGPARRAGFSSRVHDLRARRARPTSPGARREGASSSLKDRMNAGGTRERVLLSSRAKRGIWEGAAAFPASPTQIPRRPACGRTPRNDKSSSGLRPAGPCIVRQNTAPPPSVLDSF
jgi:hypothetical protein